MGILGRVCRQTMNVLTTTRNPWDRAATSATFLANGLAFGVWAGNLPRLKDALHLSDAAVGVMLFALSVGAVSAMPLSGWLAARIGAARLASIAGLCAACVLMLPSVAPGWLALLASAAALGMLLGTMDVAMNGHASAVETAWGAPIMSSFHAGWSLGGLGGSAVAGVLADAGVGLWAAYALPCTLVAALALPGLLLRHAKDRQAGGKLALPGRAIMAVAALAGLCFMAEGAVADWSGIYLRNVVGTNAAWAAAAYGFYSMAMAAGRLGGDAVVRRMGPLAIVRGGGALAVLGLTLMLAVPNPVVADAAMVLIGLGLSNIVPVVFSAAGRLQGTAGVAMAATTGYAGFMASPPVIGEVAELAGLRVALLLILAGVAALALLAGAVAVRPARAIFDAM
jgi:MFS family permease